MDHKRLKKLQSAIRAKRKRLFRSAMNAQHKEFFDQVGNHIIEKNHQGIPIKYTADVSHIQPERRELAELEFKNRDANTIDDKELLEDRIRSLELRLELHKLHVPQPMKRLIKFDKAGAKAKKNVNQGYPMESQTGLECPVCLGCGDLHPQARQYRFSRKDTLRRHFDNTHKLQTFFKSPGRPCDWPGCSSTCVSLPGYMHHLAKCHKILL